jgi:hypothetical protein
MVGSRVSILSIAVATYLAAGVGLAQSQAMQDVSKWTEKEFASAKVEWLKDKMKFNGCQKQAIAQKLSGQSSWQAIHDCMTNTAQAGPQPQPGSQQQPGRQPPPGYQSQTGSQSQTGYQRKY